MIDETPHVTPPEALKPSENEIEKRVKQSAELLSMLDQAVKNVHIDITTGKISRTPLTISLESIRTNEFMQPYKQLRAEFESGTATDVAMIKANGKGYMDVAVVAGAIVVTYDSSKQDVDILRYVKGKTSPRAEYHQASGGNLGVVFVDLNPEKRAPDEDPTTSLMHELRHHNVALMDFLLGQDSQVRMHTAVRATTQSSLFGKGFSDSPQSGFKSKESYRLDAAKYSALMGREFKPGDEGVAELQLQYLDELHSSFLQKKPNWFAANRNVYSKVAAGKHWEVVGKYPEDQEATKKILAITQACYMLEVYLLPAIKTKAAEADAPELVKNMANDWDTFFHRMGALIGTARTIHQCQKLLAQEWQGFRSKYEALFSKNAQVFKQLVEMWSSKGWASEYLADTLK